MANAIIINGFKERVCCTLFFISDGDNNDDGDDDPAVGEQTRGANS